MYPLGEGSDGRDEASERCLVKLGAVKLPEVLPSQFLIRYNAVRRHPDSSQVENLGRAGENQADDSCVIADTSERDMPFPTKITDGKNRVTTQLLTLAHRILTFF